MNFALSKEKVYSRKLHSASSPRAGGRANLIGADWSRLEQIVADLFLIGFGIGMIVAARVGPIGTATLVETIAGNYSVAFAAMAGCICAEFGLLLIAVFGVVHLNATSLALPNIAHLSVGLALLLVGLYYLTAKQMSPVGGVTTFLIAFKITLFSPNNLAALVAAIVAMGVPARLSSFANDAVFAAGEFSGVVVLLAQPDWTRRATAPKAAGPTRHPVVAKRHRRYDDGCRTDDYYGANTNASTQVAIERLARLEKTPDQLLAGSSAGTSNRLGARLY
jgi:hypothetical protein